MTIPITFCRLALMTALLMGLSDGLTPVSPANSNKLSSQLSVASALPLEVIPETVEDEEKVGVMLLNLGGPETGDDVEGEWRSCPSQMHNSFVHFIPALTMPIRYSFLSK
jgi:hypothetical protein